MNKISAAQARRYRRQHAALFACVPLALLGAIFPSLITTQEPGWLVFVQAAWFFGFLSLGLFGLWFSERRILRAVDPDPDTRRRALSVSWFRPFGTFMAINELLRSAVKSEKP